MQTNYKTSQFRAPKPHLKEMQTLQRKFSTKDHFGRSYHCQKLSREKQLATKLNLEEKWNTNWPFVSDIEIIMISNCETTDHSRKDCHHKTSRKLLIAITREKHSCSNACDENKDYKKRKSNEGPIKQFESYGQKPEHLNNEQSRHSSEVKWSKTYENEGSSYTDWKSIKNQDIL